MGSTTNYYYILRDYLGNITHKVNTSNTVVAEYSFDAWGRRRNATDWSFTLDSNDKALVADRGFTGHEFLSYFNIVNMNGRLYDPLVGRFLSPDPYIQMPDGTQSFNRYSYCLNNPLLYVDINGYTWFSKLGDWLGKNGQAIVSTVVTIGVAVGVTALIVASGGTLAPLAIAAIAGASGGLAGSVLSTAFAGGSGMDYLRNGAIGIGVGALSGMAGYGMGKLGADLASKGLMKIGQGSLSPVLNGSVTGALGASAGGAGAGYAGNFLSTLIQTGDFGLANEAGLDGAKTGALTGFGVGAATGAYGGYKYAKSHNLDPWSGKSLAANKPSWNYGDHKSQTKWTNQMKQRGWTEQQINEALHSSESFSAPNNISPNNGATRYVHPTTGRSIVIDNVTRRILHVGGDGFIY